MPRYEIIATVIQFYNKIRGHTHDDTWYVVCKGSNMTSSSSLLLYTWNWLQFFVDIRRYVICVHDKIYYDYSMNRISSMLQYFIQDVHVLCVVCEYEEKGTHNTKVDNLWMF